MNLSSGFLVFKEMNLYWYQLRELGLRLRKGIINFENYCSSVARGSLSKDSEAVVALQNIM